MIVLTLIAASVVVFASTNVDDLFVLVGFFANPDMSRARIIAGQCAGMTLLVGASLAVAFAALAVSPAHVGLLGFAPMAIGARKLWDLATRSGDAVGSDAGAQARGRGDAFAVAAVTVANGGDNLAVFAPLFASQKSWQSALSCAVFAAMTLLWCLAAWRLVDHPRIGAPLRRFGRNALPFALIALGGALVYRSGALALLAGLAR